MQRSSTILVSDADPATNDVIAEMLTDEGYRVVVVPRGGNLLKQVMQHRPALLMLDIWSRHPDEALIAEIHAVQRTLVPLIGMTTSLDAVTRSRLPNLSVWLLKPFTLAELLDAVTGAILSVPPAQTVPNHYNHTASD